MISAAVTTTTTKRCLLAQTRHVPLVSNSRRIPLRLESRWYSSTTGTCPYSKNNEDATISTKTETKLFEVPRLPIVGSLIPQYSKAPQIKPTNTYDYWYESREQFGDFYCVGIPAFGKGITGDSKYY